MKILSMLLLASLALCALAAPKDDNAAIIDGPGYTFAIAAPKGWKLTSTPDLQAAFHPADTTFAKAPVVMYVRSVDKKKLGVANPEEMNKFDLKGSQKSNPKVKSEKVGTIDAADRKGLPLYSFTGAGASELVAYADDEKTMTVFVLSAETEEQLKTTRPAFEELLKSYVAFDIIDAPKGTPATKPEKSQPDGTPKTKAPTRK